MDQYYEETLPISALTLRGIHKENSEETEISIFKNVYQQAWRAILQILEDNQKIEDNCNFDCLMRTEIQNVIAFTGRRGTGKTSAMLSIASSLNDGNINLNKIKDEIKRSILSMGRFLVLPCIEAGSLEENEKFFNVVLAKMLILLENQITIAKNSNRLFYTEINEVKQELCDLYYAGGSVDELTESNYNELIEISSRHNIRSSFSQVVKKYLNLFYRIEGKTDQFIYNGDMQSSFLVIMVDDIDVVSSRTYDILQKTFQYLMIPNVIVLTTFYMETLNDILKEKICQRKDYGATEFLRKIIPLDHRIVMPSWRRMDYRELFSIKIDIGKKGKIVRYNHPDVSVNLTEEFPRLNERSFLVIHSKNCEKEHDILSPKQLIFYMLADKTGIYLDICGKKVHFMEPDSLRHLYDLFYFFYNMEEFRKGEHKKDVYQKYTNIKSVLNMFHFKMVDELSFSDIEAEQFDEIRNEPIERRAQKVVTLLILAKGYMPKHISGNSYGDMLYSLYQDSRSTRSKKLIKAILANFSFTLPALFFEYVEAIVTLQEEQEESIEDQSSMVEKEKLYNIFGTTQLGPWSNLICYGQPKDSKCEVRFKELTVSILRLFMLVPHDRFNEIEYIFYENEDEEKRHAFRFPIDLSAFVMNAFYYKRFIVKVENIAKSKDLKFNFYIRQLDILKKELKQYALSSPYLSLPLQHTDMFYNVIKRTLSPMIYKNDFEPMYDSNLVMQLNEISLFKVIREFYESLSFELLEQDNEYKFDSLNSSVNFQERFKSCPVIRMFLSNKILQDEAITGITRYVEPEDVDSWLL